MKTELTQDDLKLMDDVRSFWIRSALGGDTSVDVAQLTIAANKIFAMIKLREPTITIHDSPFAAIMFANSIGYKTFTMDGFGIGNDCGWLAFYDFFTKIGVLSNADLTMITKFVLAGVWDSIFLDAQNAGTRLIVSRRPSVVKRDEAGRLHNPSGAAIEFIDGFKLWYWHGVSVKREWIDNPMSITPDEALGIANADRRTAACEIAGWDRIINGLNSTIVDENPDPMIGTLLRVELPQGRASFIKVLCATGRTFMIPVPNTMMTALEANAATYGFAVDNFKPEART